MKLLILSNSHKRTDRMQYAFEQCKPDAVLHLGDHTSDAYTLQRQNPEATFHMVRGNCDMQGDEDSELLLLIGGVKIYMAHGHHYNVKQGLDKLVAVARREGADLALYGHTHQAMVQKIKGLWMMNPGQMERHDGTLAASFGTVTINSGVFSCAISHLPR